MVHRATLRPWTRDDDAQLCVMLSEGRSTKTIGEALGRTPSAVDCRIRKLGLVRPAKRENHYRGVYGNADPTPAEIAVRAAAIRMTWSEEEKMRRCSVGTWNHRIHKHDQHAPGEGSTWEKLDAAQRWREAQPGYISSEVLQEAYYKPECEGVAEAFDEWAREVGENGNGHTR